MWALVLFGGGVLAQDLVDRVLLLGLGSGQGSSAELLAENQVEGRREPSFEFAFVAEHEPLEERRVELAPQLAAGSLVGGMGVACPDEGSGEVGSGRLEVGLDFGEAVFSVGDLPGQPALLALEQ